MDRSILYIDLGDEQIEPKVTQTFALRLSCKDMRIDGLKSDKEKKILQALK